LFILVLFIGYSQKPKQDIGVKSYPVDPRKVEKIVASVIFDSIVYVPLESPDEALVGNNIAKMEIVNSLLYILDKQTNTIWCFNQKGKYINKISKKGQGPGEYTSIFDFAIDRAKNHIVILDRNANKIITYDLSGKFIKEKRIEVFASDFGLLNDNKILAYTRGTNLFLKNNDSTLGYNFFVIDSDGNFDAYFPYKDETDNLITGKVIEINDNKVFANYASHDTIYEFNMDGHLLLKHVIDFGASRLRLENVKDEKIATERRNNPKYARIDWFFYLFQRIFFTDLYF
jgi:hypothetical protein